MVDDELVEEEIIEGIAPLPEYVCIKICYLNMRLLKPGDKIRLSDEDAETWLESKCLKKKKDAPVVEETASDEPETLGDIAKKDAEKTISDLEGGPEVVGPSTEELLE